MEYEEDQAQYEDEYQGSYAESEEIQPDPSSPKVIKERISKRKPNPCCYLSSKAYTMERFGERCTRGATTYAQWHDIDAKANKNGRRHMIVLDDGTEYIGEWSDNLRHGHGFHYTAEGCYEGNFVDDLYEGTGDYYLWSDDTNCDQPGKWLLYSGDWLAGKMSGNGIKYEQNGNTYEGEFSKSKKCGHGTMYYANEDIFVGEWSNDMRNGEGELTKANGDVFKGLYKDDKRNGKGELHIKETERRLEGIWADDMLKCGSYLDEAANPVYVAPDAISGTTDGMVPVLELKDPEAILRAAAEDDGIDHDYHI